MCTKVLHIPRKRDTGQNSIRTCRETHNRGCPCDIASSHSVSSNWQPTYRVTTANRGCHLPLRAPWHRHAPASYDARPQCQPTVPDPPSTPSLFHVVQYEAHGTITTAVKEATAFQQSPPSSSPAEPLLFKPQTTDRPDDSHTIHRPSQQSTQRARKKGA